MYMFIPLASEESECGSSWYMKYSISSNKHRASKKAALFWVPTLK